MRRFYSYHGQRAVGQEDCGSRAERVRLGCHSVSISHPGRHSVFADSSRVARFLLDRRGPAARVLSRRLPDQSDSQSVGLRPRLLLLQTVAVPSAQFGPHGSRSRPRRTPETSLYREDDRAGQSPVRDGRPEGLQSGANNRLRQCVSDLYSIYKSSCLFFRRRNVIVQVVARVLFLHEELMKLPSFPRKALEADLNLYSNGSMGKVRAILFQMSNPRSIKFNL